MIDETHDPSLRSWVESANAPGIDFPIQNLPAGIYRPDGGDWRIGVAIGDSVLDVGAAMDMGLVGDGFPELAPAFRVRALNPLIAQGSEARRGWRRGTSAMLRADNPVVARDRARAETLLSPIAEVEMALPTEVGDYTDFYASIHHATNVGGMFRPDNPLLPNYKYVPIGYHGRASSLVASGTTVRRPSGQLATEGGAPGFGPTRRLDYEMEVGMVIGAGNRLGEPIPIDDAESHLFGLCLVNDWSARDIQAWEYQPLGPFLAKSFATTVSPWVVTMEALAPFRVPAFARPDGDPAPLPYLSSESDSRQGGFDLTLEVWLSTERMRAEGAREHLVSRGSFRDMYWTVAQLLTHHASNGCNLRPGDLLASGTVSGSTEESRGCLLERTMRGQQPIELPTGERRAFLEDADEVVMRGYCEREGAVRIGFGECRGRVVGAV